MFNLKKQKDAQTILEYVIVIGIIALVLAAMQPLVTRGIQSIVKVTADQLGQQEKADQTIEEDESYLLGRFSDRQGRTSKELVETKGVTSKEYLYRDVARMHSNALTIGGVVNQE